MRAHHLPWLRILALFLATVVLAGPPRVVRASNNSDARLALHLLPRTSKNACGRAEAAPACPSIVTNGGLYPNLYYGYLLVTNADPVPGLAGLQCGLSYDGVPQSGVDIYTWNLCATLEFQSDGWPGSGGGNLITWDASTRCQRNEPGGPGKGVVAAAGYFYLAAYTPDALQLTVRPVDGVAKVADCSNAEYTLEGGGVHHVPSVLGSLAFSAGGALSGYNPCDPNPVIIDCTISGPDTVETNTTGHIYAAPLAPAGASYLWSVSGSGAVVGATTNPTVEIRATGPGNFSVRVAVSTAASSSACVKTVTVGVPPPTCTIIGPTQVNANSAGLTYDVVVSPSGFDGIDWSISGQGTITAGVHSTRVTVAAGAVGAFDLTATVRLLGASRPGQCTTTVTVVAPGSTCLISGPDPVLAGAANLGYTVAPGAGTITSVAWSIAGGGTILSPPNAASITVRADAVGAFELTATVQSSVGGPPAVCRKMVTVHAPVPVTCGIAGPNPVQPQTTGLAYAVSASGPITSVQWTITGQGTITSNPLASAITVTAGAVGAFDLTATVQTSNALSPGSCTLTVTVSDQVTPTCTIDGPAVASEGSLDLVYTVVASGPYDAVSWSITGNGTITSSLTAPTIHVVAGEIGAFEVAATLHGPGPDAHVCRKTVTVNPLTCGIVGPDPVETRTTGLIYHAGAALAGATYFWQITGNGSFAAGHQDPNVIVNATGVGAFTLTVTIIRNGVGHACSRTITVNSGSGGSHTQANAKLLIHLASPTAKNACGGQGAPACGQVVTSGALFPTNYFAYLLVADGDPVSGVGGLQCGITYDPASNSGVDVFNWTLCASLEFPSSGPNGPWPAAGSGNLITWDAAFRCQRTQPSGSGVVAAAGYFYCAAYSTDRLEVIPRPVDGQAKVADCAARESLIGGVGFPPGPFSRLGYARFSAGGTLPGYNPCGSAVPVRFTTWSSIKAMYREPAAGPRHRPH